MDLQFHHLLWQTPICLIGSASKPIAITFFFVPPCRTLKIACFCAEPQRVQKVRIKTELVIGVFGISPRIQTCHWVPPWAVIGYLFQQWSALGPSHHTNCRGRNVSSLLCKALPEISCFISLTCQRSRWCVPLLLRFLCVTLTFCRLGMGPLWMIMY